MTRSIYVDCFSGASGDMLLGALLHAGLSLDDLRADIAQLGLPGVTLDAKPFESHGLTGIKLDVLDEAHEHPARHLSSIRQIIGKADLPESVRQRSLAVFIRLAEAEASVHGVGLENVHFHEIGAVDSLVDIVGFCAGLERLGVEQVYASALPLGSGRITTAHGLIPVPVPATLALLARANAPTVPSPATTELVTPTGAALLTTLAEFSRPALHIERVGYGFGSKSLPWANLLRVWIGQSLNTAPQPFPAEGVWAPQAHTHEHEHVHEHEHEHAHEHDHEHEHARGEMAHDHDHEHGHVHGVEADHEHRPGDKG